MATWGTKARSTGPARKTAASALASSRRGDDTRADLRSVVSGREHEFVGIGLIAGGVLVGLAIYLKLAGVLGKAVDRALGWFCGLGRFAIPVVLVASGFALIRQRRSDRRVRLAVGWGVLIVSVLAMLHIFIVSVPSPENRWYQLGPLGGAGGWIGALAAVPARSLIGNIASVVVFLSLVFAAVLLITGLSIGALLTHSRDSVGAVTLPVGRVARYPKGNGVPVAPRTPKVA